MGPNRLPDPFDALGLLRRAGWVGRPGSVRPPLAGPGVPPGQVALGRGAGRAAVGDLLLRLGIWPEDGDP